MLVIYLCLILITAICVVFSRNIIISVINLILVFFLCSLLFIYYGVEFIGLIILIVYIGAIAVLFLFIIMMLNIRIIEVFSLNLYLVLFLSLIYLSQILLILYNSISYIQLELVNLIIYIKWSFYTNIKIVSIGVLLYNDCYILFIGATLLLFIAMLGAIILILEKKKKKYMLNFIKSKDFIWLNNYKK